MGLPRAEVVQPGIGRPVEPGRPCRCQLRVEPGEQPLQESRAAEQQDVNVSRLRYPAPDVRPARQPVAFDDRDPFEMVGRVRAATSPAMLAPITTA